MAGTELVANTNAADATISGIDFLSNGFKLRTITTTPNAAVSYIYAAFAEIPFKYSAAISDVGALSIASSTRFISGNSDYLSRTFSAGNQKTFTFSAWVKRGAVDTGEFMLLNSRVDANNQAYFRFTSNQFSFSSDTSGGALEAAVNTTAVYRDPAAWLHFVGAVDTTQAAAADRIKMWVNGVQVTSFSTATFPAQNSDLYFNNAVDHVIGRNNGAAGSYFDGYLSDVYFIDGQATTSAAFGEYDTSGYWRPKTYSGTYGTNGFHLPLMGTSTAASVGTDTSGNGNTWTVNNIATTDFVTDSPTNSFATLNPLDSNTTWIARKPVLTQGNLVFSGGVGGYFDGVKATIGASTGKWYWEVTRGSGTCVGACWLGIGEILKSSALNSDGCAVGRCVTWDIKNSGLYLFSDSPTGYAYTADTNADLVMVALDLDNGKIWFGKNGTWNQGGSPSAGTTADYSSIPSGVVYAPLVGFRDISGTTNFGQGGIASLTYDSASGGTFKYTPPSGFKALSTNNLTAPTVTIPKNYFDAVTYNSPVLLLHADGSNGATAFTDSSTSGKTMTANGNAQISTAQSKFGGSAAFFDGTTDYLSTGDSADYAFGSGDFTIDAWIRLGATGINHAIAAQIDEATAPDTQWEFLVTSGNKLQFFSNVSGITLTGNTSLSANTWYHAAIVRSGNNFTLYLDGIADGYVSSSASIDNPSSKNLTIGRYVDSSAGHDFNGYIDELRISKGSARWTVNFTPPTSAYSANTIDSANFQPDIVWLKDRTSANAHGIFDSSRLSYPAIASNAANAEGGGFGSALTGFLSNGFSLGASSTVNTSGNNYISWLWKESPTSGMDIVSYTGTGSNRTISHSLGVAPDMIIVKSRSGLLSPSVYHVSVGNTAVLKLDTTETPTTASTFWQNTSPSASVFSVGTHSNVNANGGEYIAYLFAEVDGFSKFGSYTGNAAADGPFIYTGFKPRYVMIKSSTATDAWLIYDTARDTYNVAGTTLVPNTTAADATISGIDFLSNGFKLRTITTTPNAAQTYIYAAFAEQPFYYSAQSSAASTPATSGGATFLMGMPF